MGALALLAEGPTHGYQLKAAFEARTGGIWQVNVGQIYTTLDRLAADGLVEPDPHDASADAGAAGGRDRRRWRITREGKEALEAWFDEPSIEPVPAREDFLVKVLLGLSRSRREALAIIDRQRTELYRLVQADRAARRATPPDGLAEDLMAEAIASRREADLRWLDLCEERLLAADEGTIP